MMREKTAKGENMGTRRRMECCTCGEYAGIWQQHYNRDTGYGLCPKCRDSYLDDISVGRGGATLEEMADLYGKPGVNYEARQTMTLIWTQGGWNCQCEDFREAFGTDTIPTAFTALAPAETVVSQIQALNPGCEILVR